MKKKNTSECIMLQLQIKKYHPLHVLIFVPILRNGFLIESADKSNSNFDSVIIPVFHGISKNLFQYSTESLPLKAIISSLKALIVLHHVLLKGSNKAR